MNAAPPGAPLVAVLGNPNTGKSTLFNRLTGARQRVGNYPGVTVEKTLGAMTLGPRAVTLIDLPGAYSLAVAGADEQIVLDVLTGRVADVEAPRAAICVVDATNLLRNLFLVSQVAETGLPVVIALNMIDAAERMGITVDAALLSRRLGVPVVPTVASDGRGIDELRRSLEDVLEKSPAFAPVPWPDPVRDASKIVEASVAAATGRTPAEGVVHRLLFDVDSPLPERLGWNSGAVEPTLARARGVLKDAGFDPVSVEATLRYRHIAALIEGVATKPVTRRVERNYAVDRILTHRVLGLLIFAGLMFGVFASIYWLAQPVMNGIDAAFGALGDRAGAALAGSPMLRSLVVDGAIAGVGGVVVFLPQILILFFFIGVLEDSGYMARAAFLMDKVFSGCGLNGKSFVPMLSSFACAVPAIMSTRTIEDPKARLSTILISPLMSCSARLPVYVLMIGAFIQPRFGAAWAGAALFAMHLLGLVAAIPIAWAINRFLLKLRPRPFLLEMPPYRRPRLRDVALRMVRSGREFVVRAGTIIFAFSIVVWALCYFPHPEGLPDRAAQLEQSYIGRAGKAVQPVFAPAGFDWRLTVSVLASFPARELSVSTLGIIYSADDSEKGLRGKLSEASYTPALALAVMVFFAYCLQCGSTVAIIARESGWRWAAFAFGYMTALAWLGAVAAYQIGSRVMA